MSISAAHWGMITARVTAHAKELHPKDTDKQEQLIDNLLAITTERSMRRERDTLIEDAEKRMRREHRVQHMNIFVRTFWRYIYR